MIVVLTLAAGCAGPSLSSPPPVAVTVQVDYGLADRTPIHAQTLLPAGASPIEALVDVAEVDRRYVSRTAGDVWAVEGVSSDPDTGKYWVWYLNGRPAKTAPDRYDLKNGDRITWTYAASGKPVYK